MGQHLRFAPKDAFTGAEELDMGFAYVREHAQRRLAHGGQGVDLPKMVGAHLHHRAFMLGHEAEEDLGHAGLVVEVSRGAVGEIGGGQHRADHAPCGGLTRTARDAYQRDIKLTAIGVGQGLESPDAALYTDMGIGGLDLGKGQFGAFFKCLGNEPMSVEHIPLHRHIQGTRKHGPGVNGHAVKARLQKGFRAKELAACDFDGLLNREGDHLYFSRERSMIFSHRWI